MVKILRTSLLLILLGFLLSAQPLQDTKYVGSSKSNKYHYTWCRWAKKINDSNLVIFNSVEEARNAGYVPCKVCKPPAK